MDDAQIKHRFQKHPLIQKLQTDIQDIILKVSKPTTYRANRAVLKEGDAPEYVFCLLEGAVRVFHKGHYGREVVVKLFKHPAWFGEMEVLTKRPFLENVTALEVCEILLIPGKTFRSLVQREAAFAAALVLDLSARLCIATHNEKALAFCDVDARLANILLDYCSLFGHEEEGVVRIGIKLSQDRLAGDLGVCRKSIARSIRHLEKTKILGREKGYLLVRNMKALKKQGSGFLGLSYQLLDSETKSKRK